MQKSILGRPGFLTIAGGVLAVLACSGAANTANPGASSSGQQPGPLDGPGIPVNTADLDAYVQKLAERCEPLVAGDKPDPTTEATLRDARAAYKRGETDIPLSTQGCSRMYVQRSGDKEALVAIVAPPFSMKLDDKTFGVKKTAAMMSWTTGADGKKELRADLDADGFEELKETVTPNVSVVTDRIKPTGEVVHRTTAKVAEGGMSIVVTEESDDDGALAVNATYEGARVSRKCTTDPPPGNPPPQSTPPRPASPFPPPPHEVACTPEQLHKLDSLLEQATNGGASCMAAAGMPDLRFRLLRQMATTSFDFKCTDDPSFVAANDGGYGNVFQGRGLLWINPLLFTGSPAQQVGTLYHEMMHFFFVHDHDVEALADYSTNLAYSDRVYACEALCFAPNADSCHLAACKKTKICKADKFDFEQKTGREIKSCYTGHQVGALCRKGPGQRQWCTTKSECDAACGGQECESKSISCNENCR